MSTKLDPCSPIILPVLIILLPNSISPTFEAMYLVELIALDIQLFNPPKNPSFSFVFVFESLLLTDIYLVLDSEEELKLVSLPVFVKYFVLSLYDSTARSFKASSLAGGSLSNG